MLRRPVRPSATSPLAGLVTLPLLLLLASPPPALGDEREEEKEEVEPDAHVLADLKSTQDAMTTERAAALRLLYRLNAAGYDAKLAELAAAGSPERKGAIEALRLELVRAWNLDHQAFSRQWPVDPRLGCRDQALALQGALEKPQSKGAKADLPRLRSEAHACLERMEPPVEAIREANRALLAVVAEVERLVGTSPAATPTPAGTALPPAPPPVPAGGARP